MKSTLVALTLVLVAALIGAGAYTLAQRTVLPAVVAPTAGVELPIAWGRLGPMLTESGVVDRAAFDAVYADRGGVPEDVAAILDGASTQPVHMTSHNAGAMLNLLWALGLGNESDVLTSGPLATYGGDLGGFASTGGWGLAAGPATEHLGKHQLVPLTPDQAALVATVAHNVYRPCCSNPTDFPDCNHGMAMLGLLELLASQGASEDQLYRTALAVNTYWFPDAYRSVARLAAQSGVGWTTIDPSVLLSARFSSSAGLAAVNRALPPLPTSGGSSCAN